jgi:hypothetical protein
MSVHVAVEFVGRVNPVPDRETTGAVGDDRHDRVPDEDGTRSGTMRAETTG